MFTAPLRPAVLVMALIAGVSSPSRIAMIAITASSSTRLKAPRGRRGLLKISGDTAIAPPLAPRGKRAQKPKCDKIAMCERERVRPSTHALPAGVRAGETVAKGGRAGMMRCFGWARLFFAVQT
jgi:hypothetical protein